MSEQASAVSVRRRLAAIVALAATIVLVVTVVDILVGNGGSLVVGLGGVCLAIAGGWWLLTERSTRRAVGVAGLSVGVVVIATAMFMALDGADRVALRVVLVVGLLAVALACSRWAMLRE